MTAPFLGRFINVVVQHLVDTLNKFKVPDAEQKDLLGIIGTLKNDIVENK